MEALQEQQCEISGLPKCYPLYDKEASFGPKLPMERNTDSDKNGSFQLVIKIDFSRPNQIKFLANKYHEQSPEELTNYKINMTLTSILSFMLHRLAPAESVKSGKNEESSKNTKNASKNSKNPKTSRNFDSSTNLVNFCSDQHGKLLAADSSCPFWVNGMQQISTTKSNMLLILIEPVEPKSAYKNELSKFQQKVQVWLRKYSAKNLFFTELGHIFRSRIEENNSHHRNITSGTKRDRQNGIFDTCKLLPTHVDSTYFLGDYLDISSDQGLIKVFGREPSLLWNTNKPEFENTIIEKPDFSLINWPILAIGENLLREPRITTEYFARVLTFQCAHFVGFRLSFPSRKQIDKISLKENNSSRFGLYQQRLGINSTENANTETVPTLSICIRGNRALKTWLREACGPSDLNIARQKLENQEQQINLNGQYASYFKDDRSYFWTPLNQGVGMRSMAMFFGGRMAAPDSVKMSVENYPEGLDELLDMVRKECKDKLLKGDEKVEDSVKNTVGEDPEATEPENTKKPQKSGKKGKKGKKSKSAKKDDDLDIDALVAELKLDVYDAPTQEDSLFYTLSLGPVEEILLILSPAVETHLLPNIQTTCLEYGFKIKSCNACSLQVENKKSSTSETKTSENSDCGPQNASDFSSSIRLDPDKLNIGRLGQTKPDGKNWTADEIVRVFYPDEGKRVFDSILEGGDHGEELVDKCERFHEKIGAKNNMECRASYVLHLSRENAHMVSQSLRESCVNKRFCRCKQRLWVELGFILG